MPWLCAILHVAEPAVEELSDALLAAGALAVDVQDAAAGTAAERPIFAEPGEAPATGWQANRVSALFPIDADLHVLIPQALAEAGIAPASEFRVERVEDADWVRLTQSQFQPLQITPRLWVVPSWHELPDPAAVNIVLDPGVAFGTGAHPTTRLCLRWLDTVVTPDADVLDYGCGSGILAIAAMKLGARSARGIDIDPQAVLAAQDNAERNRVKADFAAAADDAPVRPARIVVANILANPLTVLAPLLARLTLPGGRIALSGILSEQTQSVLDAYASNFDMQSTDHDDGWVLLTGFRR
ncbi:MAG: 50S ribosomal protein L11 methyltransferase [Burkholderiales bacterium]|jgi:ribosomal protein L11 methyltransferase|nr:50S ribosomal protein L11 methyltransferase [Burkholderiales bacterium]